MNRFFAYAYIILGFLGGFAVGVITEKVSALTFERFALVIAILFAFSGWQWFEHRSHKRHLAKWNVIRSQGKWRFVTVEYGLHRGIVLLLLVFAPIFLLLELKGNSLFVLSLTVLAVLLILAVLGYNEWVSCEQEFEVSSLKETVERVKRASLNLPLE